MTGVQTCALPILRQEILTYLKIGERWDAKGKDWTPVELSHYYDTDPKYHNHYLTVADAIDKLSLEISERERYKNGRVLKSQGTARLYGYLKPTLEKFTRSKYRRDFSKYHFRDLNEKFIQVFAVWIQVQGAKSGTKGGVDSKRRKLKAVCHFAKKLGAYSVNIDIFDSVKSNLKPRQSTPKGVSPEVMEQIENFDRELLTKKEQLYLDLFLFSYYAGGMSPIDVCLDRKSVV